jgi:hypothetical protein
LIFALVREEEKIERSGGSPKKRLRLVTRVLRVVSRSGPTRLFLLSSPFDNLQTVHIGFIFTCILTLLIVSLGIFEHVLVLS